MMDLKGVGDILFVLDTSGSMNPIFNYLIENLFQFVQGLKIEARAINQWDLRIGVAAGDSKKFFIIPFNSDPGRVQGALEYIKKNRARGNECMLMAMDLGLTEFEWRTAARRIMIVFTDETLSTNYKPPVQRNGLQDLVTRLIEMKIMLIFHSPKCPDYEMLGRIPKSIVRFISSQKELTNEEKLETIFEALQKTLSRSFLEIDQQAALRTKYENRIYSEQFEIEYL